MKIGHLKLLVLLVSIGISSCSERGSKSDLNRFSEVKVYDDVDIHEIPEYLGGKEKMDEYFNREINTNAIINSRKDLSGVVFVDFIIDSTGKVNDVRLRKGLQDDLNNVVVAAVEEMPAWAPGFVDGYPVNVHCTLPIPIPYH